MWENKNFRNFKKSMSIVFENVLNFFKHKREKFPFIFFVIHIYVRYANVPLV